MITNLKAMIVVLAIAMAVFAIARPISLRFMAEHDFSRRRNVWIALTLTAFMSPSFWLFVLVAIPLLAWGARKDTNPVAFYLFVLHVISPTDGLDVSVPGIKQLFEINIYRILSIAVLIPAAWRLMQSTDKTGFRLTSMDVLILAYGGLQLILFMPYESLTNTMRRGFLFFIDVLLLYFVVSRTCTSRRAIAETMASFCLACAIFAPLAIFESLRGWPLYTDIGAIWGVPQATQVLMRAGSLRAQVSAGHSIALGYLMAIAFGFWLYLRTRMHSTALTIAVAIWMWLGLLAAYSRAPWLVAVFLLIAYLALVPKGSAQFFKTSLIAALVAGLVLVSPIGEYVIDNLPFVGTVDAGTVTYRQWLAEMSWMLIQKHPFLGDPFFMSHMEQLRQGQGIIDLVNTYATVTLQSGIVGLCLLVSPFLVGMWNAYRCVRRSAGPDPDVALLGVNLIACMFATLLMLATVSFILGFPVMFWMLAGLAAGYAQLGQLKPATQTSRPDQSGPYHR
jgi:O-antigen ligase